MSMGHLYLKKNIFKKTKLICKLISRIIIYLTPQHEIKHNLVLFDFVITLFEKGIFILMFDKNSCVINNLVIKRFK